MAKTRAQRKAERRAREEQETQAGDYGPDARSGAAQHDTQVPVSGESQIKASERGIAPARSKESLAHPDAPAHPGQAPRRGKKRGGEPKSANEDAEASGEQQLARKQKQAKRRTPAQAASWVFCPCSGRAEEVQWPDQRTLVQATAVTVTPLRRRRRHLPRRPRRYVFNFLDKQDPLSGSRQRTSDLYRWYVINTTPDTRTRSSRPRAPGQTMAQSKCAGRRPHRAGEIKRTRRKNRRRNG